MSTNNQRNICVIVLGDIGRSPRMQYHVRSLLNHNFNVDLIGYLETPPLDEIKDDPRVKIHKLSPFPELNLPNLLKYIFKSLWQMLNLFTHLFSIRRPNVILCQNPPGIPTLFVCYAYCCLFVRCKFIIDWHNYTHTILSIAAGPTGTECDSAAGGGSGNSDGCGGARIERREGLVVRVAKWVESYFGRKSAYNFCVTKAMQEDLRNSWGIKATVLYDRPPAQFQSISIAKKHELFYKLSEDYHQFLGQITDTDEIESTAFTYKDSNGTIHLRPKRPGILVSSTSWTPDEDFSVLLRALEVYEESANRDPNHYPNLLCIITGKGPQKVYYLEIIAKRNWKKVEIITPWLAAEDYPLCLASADLGVCLHWSSSGLDLPMKIVDMFGCGLPVCAISYNCLNELVQHGKNGFIFESTMELSQQILSWFQDFPKNIALVNIKEAFSHNLREFQQLRWDDNWNQNALPAFTS